LTFIAIPYEIVKIENKTAVSWRCPDETPHLSHSCNERDYLALMTMSVTDIG